MLKVRVLVLAVVVILLAGASFAWDSSNPPPRKPGTSTAAAMWLSIAHPGVGEWYNAGWGGWQNCNKKKFWTGFIPLYGWPGYLQVRSAINAKRGGTW